MQEALSSGQYSLIKTISDLLSVIDKHEAGESYTIGDSEIELELKKDLESDFMPEGPEQITLSASSLDTYISCPLKFRMSKNKDLLQRINAILYLLSDTQRHLPDLLHDSLRT